MLKSLVLLACIGSAAAIPGYITHLTWNGKYLTRGVRTSKYGVDYYGEGSPVYASSTNRTGTQWNVAFDYVKYVQDGLCLDAGSINPVAGSKVHLWTCHGEPQQQWEVANGQVKLVGKNLCLDVPDGDATQWVQVWDCIPGNKNQKFDAAPEGSVGGQC